MKKYRRALIGLGIVFTIMYLIPIIMYLTDFLEGTIMNNMLYVINPLTLFICSAFSSKKNGDFYVFPSIYSILFIPLTFTIYNSSYLSVFFLYIIISLIGGLFGLWCNTNSEVAKAFKKAFGITAIIAGLFTLAYLIVDIYTFQCEEVFCSIYDLITFNNIQLLIIIILVFLFAIYCLKKEKKKD